MSAVAAARKVDESGKIVVYEAGVEQAGKTVKIVDLNNVESIVETENALVGTNVRVWRATGSVSRIEPSELPNFDVLEMDCEAAGVQTLENMEFTPKIIIVEVHPDNINIEKVKSLIK